MAQKRIDYYGQFTPTGVDTSQAKRLQALSGLAEQVGDIAFEVGAKIQTKRGAEAGIESGMEAAKDVESPEAPELREGFLSQISIYDQAYNEAALNAYSSGIRVDGRKKLMELEEQFADEPDPEKFGNQWEGYIKGVTKGLPPEMAANLRLSLEDEGMLVGGRITDARKKIDFDTNLATINEELDLISDDMAAAARDGNETLVKTLSAKMENRIQENIKFVSPAEAQKRRNELEDRLILQGALGQIDRAILDNEEGLSLEERIENGKQILRTMTINPVEELSPEQNSKLQSLMSTRINELESRFVEQNTAQGIELSDFSVKVAEGFYTDDEVDEITKDYFDRKVITRNEMTSFRLSSRDASKKKAETLATNKAITRQLGDKTRNPSYLPTQSQANTYYDDVYAPSIEGGSPDQKAIADSMYIKGVRVIPDAVKRQTNAYLVSDNPEQMMQAFQTIDRVDAIPGFFGQLVNADQKVFARNVIDLMDFYPPEEAMRIAITRRDNPAIVKDQEAVIKKKKYAEDYKKWTADIVEVGSPIELSQAATQYQLIFENFFLTGSTEQQSREQAEKMLTSNFGGQEFGSMMYPPESYYGVNGSVSYLRDDLDFIIRDENPNIEFDKNKIFLISDDHTARKAVEGNPQYKVLFQDNNGVFNQLPDYFNPAEEKEAQERAVDAEGEALVKEIRAGGEYVKRRAQFEEKLESYEQTGRDLEYKERQAEYEAREGRPRRSVPASELYGDVTIASAFGSAVADSASLVADVAEAAIETKRAIIEPISDVVAEAGSRVIKSGERRRSAIISDTERRKGKE